MKFKQPVLPIQHLYLTPLSMKLAAWQQTHNMAEGASPVFALLALQPLLQHHQLLLPSIRYLATSTMLPKKSSSRSTIFCLYWRSLNSYWGLRLAWCTVLWQRIWKCHGQQFPRTSTDRSPAILTRISFLRCLSMLKSVDTYFLLVKDLVSFVYYPYITFITCNILFTAYQ